MSKDRLEIDEMTKRLKENPRKKFYVSLFKNLIAKVNPLTDSLEFINTNVKGIKTEFKPKIDWTWEEVEEPIGFIGVLETLEESREESRWTVEDERYAMGMMNCTLGEILANLGENYSDESIARILLNSDWYRED